MSFLRKRGPKPAEIPQLTGLQIQTSSNAVPIPIVYGVNKISHNLIWTGKFEAIPEYTKTGGKGGGRGTLSGYHYKADLALGLCEGPIWGVDHVWKDQSVTNIWGTPFGLFYGSATQAPWSYLGSEFWWQALSYRGLAYVVSASHDLGASATLGAMQWEILGRLYPPVNTANQFDADPALVIYDFLTSAQYGVGFPAASIDATSLLGSSGGSSFQAYCKAVGIAFSPVLANRESANTILTRWLQLTNSAAVWSGGKLKFIPYGDQSITGAVYPSGTCTFTPNFTPVYALTDDDFVREENGDPVQIERKDPYALHNFQSLEISYRLNGYNSSTVHVWDQGSIELYGRRDGPTIAAHEITEPYIASRVGNLILQRHIYIRNTYSFRLSFEFCLLEPMDIVTLTDSALGLASTPVRIVSIEEDEDGLLSVTAEEFSSGVGTALAYPVQANEASILERNVVPSSVNPPVIFEPPVGLSGGERQVWIAVSGGLATTRRLEEDGSTGEHNVAATIDYPAGSTPAIGTGVSFRAYVLAGERTACRLRIHDGVAVQSVSFDLATGAISGATAGIMASSIEPVTGGSWYLVTVACAIAAAVDPVVSIVLENPLGTVSYSGTAGDGLFVWNPEVSIDGTSPSILTIPFMASGAAFDPDAEDPPLGVEGEADPMWGGCIVHLSTDDATYGQIGQINGPARQGVTTASLESGGSLLSVSLVQSAGTLEPASPSDAANGVTLSLVEDELLAYSGAMLAGPNTYDVTGLVRGLQGTMVPTSHPSGSRFARLDDAIFKYALPAAYVGQVLYLKFQSFNIFGLGLQDLATCSTYVYRPTGLGAGMGPILQALALGQDVDLGLLTEAVTIEEDLSVLSYAPSTTVDLGAMG